MSSVFRDFIPEGDAATPAETRRRETARAYTAGGLRQDFIPGPDHVLAPPSGNRHTSGDAAIAAAMDRQQKAITEDWRAVVEKMRLMTVQQATEYIRTAPSAVAEMAVTAEMLHGARSSLLARFPTPDPATVEKYTYIDASLQSGVVEEDDVPVDDAEDEE